MRNYIASGLLFLVISMSGSVQASWLSVITGVDVDANRGTICINPPDLSAIPEMIHNLPKDIVENLLNPAAPALATAIRFSRGQALNRGVSSMPAQIRQQLAPYFPPQILDKARWTTAGGISLDGALVNWFNLEGAITYDEVIVFSSTELTNNLGKWAHELTHVTQYSQMGIETFAFMYTIRWDELESDARTNASRIIASINATNQGKSQSWSYQGQPGTDAQQPTWDAVNKAAIAAYREHVWIMCLYRDLLDRKYDIEGLDNWCRFRHSGRSVSSIVDGFLYSEEFCTRYATSLYRSLLDREPDAGGLNNWKSALQNGASFQKVIVGFCDSSEFRTKHPVPGEFVEALYNKLLGRHSDPDGYARWVNAINSGVITANIINGFLASEEYATKRVTENYRNYLHREPDPQGLLNWTNAVRSGTAMQKIICGFLASDEYRNAVIAR